MKNRAELYSIFQKFYVEILTQFNIFIRVLHSNNAREYFSAPFISFMSQHGILHQSSCAHSPQQNGVVERKNRHLIERARTLLLHYQVPFRFWGDVVLTTCYLINRMPSSVCYMIRFLIHFFSLTNHFISFFLVSLVVLALFIFSLQDKTKFPPKPRNASSWATHDFRRVIVVIPLILIDTFSLLLSPSLRTHPSLPPPSLFLLLKSYPLPSSPHLYLMMYLLDHFRFIIVVTVPLFLSLLLRPMLTHFLSLQLLLPRLCLLLITYPLLFRKVIDLLAILILFTIF